jgi:hypothetical protein
MKGLIKYGLAATMVFATAMATPALAKEKQIFDVCINPATDVATQDDPTKPGAFATAAANIFPKGTIPNGGLASCPQQPGDRHVLCQRRFRIWFACRDRRPCLCDLAFRFQPQGYFCNGRTDPVRSQSCPAWANDLSADARGRKRPIPQ